MSRQIYTLSCEDALAFVLEAGWGFAEVDPDGKFIWVNPAYCEILNAPVDLILGTTFQKWTHLDDVQIDVQSAEQVKNGITSKYTLAKRYVQRGHTPINPREIWGNLTVYGKWSETKEFLGYRCTFQPYSQPHESLKVDFKKYLKWGVENWKTILLVITTCATLILGGSETLLEKLNQAKDAADQVDSVLSPSSSPDGP